MLNKREDKTPATGRGFFIKPRVSLKEFFDHTRFFTLSLTINSDEMRIDTGRPVI